MGNAAIAVSAALLLLILPAAIVSALSQHTFGSLVNYEFITEQSIHQHNSAEYRLRFQAYKQQFCIHLSPNHHRILHSQPIITTSDNSVLDYTKIAKPMEGSVYDCKDSDYLTETNSSGNGIKPIGWSRLTFGVDTFGLLNMNDFDGVVFDGKELYTLQPTHVYHRQKRSDDVTVTVSQTSNSKIIIYRDSIDRLQKRSLLYNQTTNNDHFCGTEFSPETIPSNSLRLSKRQQQTTTSNEECPKSLRVLYMGVAADCGYTESYGGSDGALRQIISDWNQASKVYQKQFNVILAIHTISLQTECRQQQSSSVRGDVDAAWNRQCSADYPISQRLSDFSQWRGKDKSEDRTNGLWILMTKCSSGSTIGISWLNMACVTGAFKQTSVNSETIYVSGTSVVSAGPSEWLVVAHEIAHSFGANHDCNSQMCSACPGLNCQCCPCGDGCDCKRQFIMNPTSEVVSTEFSQCSTRAICRKLSELSADCLRDPGEESTVEGNTCGNGIREQGEDCDCGPADGEACKSNRCCDAKTCKFAQGAKCDATTDGCCTDDCQFRKQGSLCRQSASECDREEKCSGTSGSCPPNQFVADTTVCRISLNGSTPLMGQCASGQCTSRDLQCQRRGSIKGDLIKGQCESFSDQCAMYCEAVDGRCMLVNGYFIDGTVCGYGGRCMNGNCETSTLGTLIGWIRKNQSVAIIIGIAIFLILLACIWESARRLCCPPAKKNYDIPLEPISTIAAFNNDKAITRSSQQSIVVPPRPVTVGTNTDNGQSNLLSKLMLHVHVK